MDYLNPRGKPFTSADVVALLRSLSKVPIDPLNFEGEERDVAVGLQAIQKRVDESISLYESRQGKPLSHAKRSLLKQSLTAKLLQSTFSTDNSSVSLFLKRSQKSFEELLKLSEKRRTPPKEGS
ncbi:MAG: hypothetical protein V4507_08585 [Verrucomicrobiota bacterium]